jgi:hypothetical protein
MFSGFVRVAPFSRKFGQIRELDICPEQGVQPNVSI